MELALAIVSSCLALSLVTVYILLQILKQVPRQGERERAKFVARETELLDRIMYLSGNTWSPPPRPKQEEEELSEELKAALEGWRPV
jgi:hypothetical protein